MLRLCRYRHAPVGSSRHFIRWVEFLLRATVRAPLLCTHHFFQTRVMKNIMYDAD